MVQVKKKGEEKYIHGHDRAHRLPTAQIQAPVHMGCGVM